MPVSSTLVDRLRRMTAVSVSQYTIDSHTYWSDTDLTGALEGRICARLLQAEIDLIPTVKEGGGIEFVNGQVRLPGTLDTENASVISFGGTKIAGTTIHDDGRIEFTTSQVTSAPLLSGLCYDLNGAAADVLTDWAAAVKLGYDLSTDGQSLKRSQRHEQLLSQAEAFRARAVVGSINLGRSDSRPAGANTGKTRAALTAFERWGQWGG